MQHTSALLAVLLALAAAAPGALEAQVLQGRIIDARNLSSVPGAMVRLLDSGGSLRALTIADDDGRYAVRAPAPGTYKVVAARLGIEDFQSKEVAMPDRDGVYDMNLMVLPSAIEIEGVEVTAMRERENRRALRLVLGTNPSTLRTKPLTYDQLLAQVERGRTLRDVVRYANVPGMIVSIEEDGPPCFKFRGLDCAPIFLDGSPVPAELVNQIPLDLLETMLFVQPGESVDYGGSILMYTYGWLAQSR